MNVKGCLGCEYCHNKGEGKCVQQDDMQRLYPEFFSADMVVFASPIVGATKVSHFDQAVKSVDLMLSEEDVKYLDELYVPHRLMGQIQHDGKMY